MRPAAFCSQSPVSYTHLIPIGELVPFKNHPFKVLDDESMQRLSLIHILRWAASHKNVKVVLSGMSAEDQLDDNLGIFSSPESL